MKKTQIVCDVCNANDHEEPALYQEKQIQVIFTTDQTEGRGCAPYLEVVKIDLCQQCMTKVLEGNYIFAQGAQGYNTYQFR